MKPKEELPSGRYRGVLIFIVMVLMALFINGCAEKKMPLKYKHQNFYLQKKVIVQSIGKFIINDIPEGEVNN